MRFLRAPGGSESLKMSINIVLPVPTRKASARRSRSSSSAPTRADRISKGRELGAEEPAAPPASWRSCSTGSTSSCRRWSPPASGRCCRAPPQARQLRQGHPTSAAACESPPAARLQLSSKTRSTRQRAAHLLRVGTVLAGFDAARVRAERAAGRVGRGERRASIRDCGCPPGAAACGPGRDRLAGKHQLPFTHLRQQWATAPKETACAAHAAPPARAVWFTARAALGRAQRAPAWRRTAARFAGKDIERERAILVHVCTRWLARHALEGQVAARAALGPRCPPRFRRKTPEEKARRLRCA